jgi:cell division septum initiation protein DivIVA
VTLARGSTQTRDAQGIVDAAKDRAQNIEQEAVDWAERLIASAQQRAAEIVSDAEERVEQIASRSSQLTVDYLQEVFSLLKAGVPSRQPDHEEPVPEPEQGQEARPRLEVAPVREGPWERAPEGTSRPNLGIVPKAGEGA